MKRILLTHRMWITLEEWMRCWSLIHQAIFMDMKHFWTSGMGTHANKHIQRAF